MDARSRWEAAYHATEYRVPLPRRDDLILRVGRHDAAADEALRKQCGVRTHWVILTPCNPASGMLDEAANAQRRRDCGAALERRGLRHHPARNHDPSGKWPDEPGFLLCDPEPGAAEELGKAFGQNALLAGILGQAPQLVWLA